MDVLDVLNERIASFAVQRGMCSLRDGFVYHRSGDEKEYLLISNPVDEICTSPLLPRSARTLEEHIELVNRQGLDRALISARDIGFLSQCPSLRHLIIRPSDSAADGFDFSPLYRMPEVHSLACRTQYGPGDQYIGYVDYARINGLRKVSIDGKGHLNYNTVRTLEEFYVRGRKVPKGDFSEFSCSDVLEKITLVQCSLKSLQGIRTRKLRELNVWYNRTLADISRLEDQKDTLISLSLQNCPAITDFGVLGSLINLEYLHLEGKNVLPDVKFLHQMPNLKMLILGMDVADKDLSPCRQIPHVTVRGKCKRYDF